MRKKQEEERTQQVQFRMPKPLHRELRKALLDDDLTMADFFNTAAKKYIKRHSKKNNNGGQE